MQTKLKVEGMTCSHCENAVKKAVTSISGVANVMVDLAGKTVTVTHNDKVTAYIIKHEIEEQGYDVIT
jgi:copper ion binding protein